MEDQADPPFIFTELARLARQAGTPWTRVHAGVDLHRLYGGSDGPSAALLRYAPGGRVPLHRHQGYEHIYVLAGSQRDQNGVYGPGTLVVNHAGSSHAIFSPEGCLVLAIWERPVAFIGG